MPPGTCGGGPPGVGGIAGPTGRVGGAGGPARLVDACEHVGQGGALCAYLLDGRVVRPGGAHQP
ncbi:hypothetical protein AB0I41_22190, partial [Micromonospora sp. NPDC050200]